jgi:hypothetical protein
VRNKGISQISMVELETAEGLANRRA